MNKVQCGEKIGFVGLSHLGMVSSICWSSLGWHVVGVDNNPDTVSDLAAGRLPIYVYEPQLADLLRDNRSRLKFSCEFSSLAECDVVFISLDTETDQANQSILFKLEQLVNQVIPWLASGVTVFLMSQVPVGFTRRLGQRIHTTRPDLKFELYYWVETLVIGNAVERCLRPERVVLGGDSNEIAENSRLEVLLSTFSCPVIRMSYDSAELTKAAINLYLSVTVTFANVLADFCEATGASMKEIIPALRLDRRIGQYAYIRPGLGIAGGNLERDLVHLQRLGAKYGTDTGLIDYVLDHSAKRYQWVHRQLARYVYPHTSEPKIALWGLTYKKNTQSTQNSFAVRILRDLFGKAYLSAYDPVASLPTELQTYVTRCDRYEALKDADCLLVLTDWDEFADTDYATLANKMHGRVIVDCVRVLDREAAILQGFRYISIGDPHE